jgi:hypothetical protein
MSVEKKDVELTEEMRKKIEQYMAIEPAAEFRYVPKVYRDKKNNIPKELWPVFILRGLDGIEATLNEDRTELSVVNGSYKLNTGESKLYACRHGIVSWKNLRNSKGALIPDPVKNVVDGCVSDASLKQLSPSLIAEIANAVNEQSRLSPEEESGLE